MSENVEQTAGAINKLSGLDTLCTSWFGRKQHTDISGGAAQQTAVVYDPTSSLFF